MNLPTLTLPTQNAGTSETRRAPTATAAVGLVLNVNPPPCSAAVEVCVPGIADANALRTMNAGSVQASTSLIEAAKDWIGGMIEGGVGSISTDAGLLEVLRSAMEIERATEVFYREQGAASEDNEVRVLFGRLAEIEKGHFLFVSSLVEYYDRPNEWVESAEFGLRDEY